MTTKKKQILTSGYKAKKGKKGKKKNESINEGPSTEEKELFKVAIVRKQIKYRTVSLEQVNTRPN